MKCTSCGDAIPQGRLEAIPNCQTCVACSSTKKVKAYQYIHGKTGHTYHIVSAEMAERIGNIQKRSGQSPSNGMKGYAKNI